jgi:hypothetical protein
MPPRFTYWTILIGAEPTAFRARERHELVPTLRQLQRKQPAATLKWFAHGRVWDSPEHERETRAAELRRRMRSRRPERPERAGRPDRPGPPGRPSGRRPR